jgi:hypothetical protein
VIEYNPHGVVLDPGHAFSLKCFNFSFSMGIESVVQPTDRVSSGGRQDASCSVCEMAVVWMQNQLKQNQTEERIINYANSVI